jgi:hypothetical protein
MRIKYKVVGRIKDNSGAAKPLFPLEAKRPLLISANALKDVKMDRQIASEKEIKTVFFVK